MDFIRLSDVIARSLDNDKIKSIVQMVADIPDIDIEDRAASLVVSGAALGVDEALTRMPDAGKEYNEFLTQIIVKIDEMLDQSPSLEVSTALAVLRGMLAEQLAKYLEKLKQTFAAHAYTGLGISAELVFSDTPPEEYARLDLVGVGTEIYRRHPGAALGWHYGRTKGLPEDFKCHCPACYQRLFNSSPISAEVGLRQMVTDSEGMDNAMAEFAVYTLTYLRSEFANAQSKAPSLHNVDPVESQSQFNDLLSRIRGE